MSTMIPDMVPRGIWQIALLLDLWGLAKISHTRARKRKQQALSKDSGIRAVVSKQYHYKTSAIIDLYSCHPGIQDNSTKTNHSFPHIPCNETDPTSKHKKNMRRNAIGYLWADFCPGQPPNIFHPDLCYVNQGHQNLGKHAFSPRKLRLMDKNILQQVVHESFSPGAKPWVCPV